MALYLNTEFRIGELFFRGICIKVTVKAVHLRSFQKGENKERKNKRVETSLTAYGYGFGRRTIEEG